MTTQIKINKPIISLKELECNLNKPIKIPYVIYYGISKETYDNEIYNNSIRDTLYNGAGIYLIILDLPDYRFPIFIDNMANYNKVKETLKKSYISN